MSMIKTMLWESKIIIEALMHGTQQHYVWVLARVTMFLAKIFDFHSASVHLLKT